MVLKRGDKGDAVKVFQRHLNKLGAMLAIDGDFGKGTTGAVVRARAALKQPGSEEADDALQTAVANFPDPCPALTAAGMTFIAQFEVTDAARYEAKFQSPTVPPKPSGVTIGIGYDLRFVNQAEFDGDWGELLPAEDLTKLGSVLQKEGTDQLLAPVSTIIVPLSAAMQVFAKRSIPKFLDLARARYPQIDGPSLTAAQRTALVSLVYNRGNALEGEGDRRREMKTIQELLAAGKIGEVPAQFESMTRLWDPATERGLITRRRAEAALWSDGFASARLD
jgi:peptidoglycan hydrolase-like protein with peptidoglycan-binding domain